MDCLLDAVQALVADCDHPAIRKIKNIDAFVNRCKLTVLGEHIFNLLFRCHGVRGDWDQADEAR